MPAGLSVAWPEAPFRLVQEWVHLMLKKKGLTVRYIGETARTMAERNREHQEDCIGGEPSYMREHTSANHPEDMENILDLI